MRRRWFRRLFNDPNQWFGPKRLGSAFGGAGVEPRTWEGWAIFLAAVCAGVAAIVWFAGYR